MKKILTISLLWGVLSACGSGSEATTETNTTPPPDSNSLSNRVLSDNSKPTQQHRIQDLYSLEAPITMMTTDALNEEASFQSADETGEVYFFVVHDRKDELEGKITLKDYYNFMQGAIVAGLPDPKPSDIEAFNLGNLKGLKSRVSTTFNNYGIIYQIIALEGEEHFYQLIGWTMARNTEGIDDLERMIRSFKEL
ncbi:hypothetical protein [Eisenibacter elegans]|jgi:hypothetical protein|uniref:hypothetical protein n=1 Tax=Eisenibacter elegans TaxID=997 RepID=UPI00040F4B9B|nr:hypothetical protein [Eisenibacter elegans]